MDGMRWSDVGGLVGDVCVFVCLCVCACVYACEEGVQAESYMER